MIERTEIILEWWKANQGYLVGVENVLPHVVLHQAPEPTDDLINPLLLGANSLQREIIGSTSPTAFREELSKMPISYNAQALRSQKKTVESWHPNLAQGQVELCCGQRLAYRRLILPVRLKNGARMIMTFSEQMTLH